MKNYTTYGCFFKRKLGTTINNYRITIYCLSYVDIEPKGHCVSKQIPILVSSKTIVFVGFPLCTSNKIIITLVFNIYVSF